MGLWGTGIRAPAMAFACKIGVEHMPRTRADDYDQKKKHILDVSASMFAKLGYVGCKMEDVAEKCGVSKSMLYYYFPRKEDILFEILRGHVTNLNGAIEEHLKTANSKDPVEFFRGYIEVYLERSSNARERHAVMLNDTRFLPRDMILLQENLERRNVQLTTEILERVAPGNSATELKVYAFLLLGMINWVELWFHDSGSVSRPELYDRIASVFLKGFLKGFQGKYAAPAASSRTKRKELRGGRRGPIAGRAADRP